MVKPLKYDEELSLQEADARLHEVSKEFDRLKERYTGFFSIFKRNLRSEDNKTLSDCVGVLLPLSLERSVQEELRFSTVAQETVWYRAGQLQSQILDYLARFPNTGVKIYEGTSPFW